jgi:hypothetical protein
VTFGVGYFGAVRLTELFGQAGAIRTVACCGIGVWLLAQALFGAAGFPLIVKLPDKDTTGPTQNA